MLDQIESVGSVYIITKYVAFPVYILDIVSITSSIVLVPVFCIHLCRTTTTDVWMVMWITNVLIFLNEWNVSGKYVSIFLHLAIKITLT